MSTQTPAPAPPSDKFPSGIPFIVGNEGAERFSFYGMKAILKIHMIALFVRFVDQNTLPPEVLADAKARSTQVVHLFVAGVYAFPLIGALLADRLLGKFRVIFSVSLVYCLGHAVLAVAGRVGALEMWQAAEYSMYLGLFLIAVGSGGIKPCVSANVGDQFTAANGHLVTKVFQIFYFIINYGSFFSTIVTPLLLRYANAEIAFGVPGVLMGIATIVFWLGRKNFVQVAPRPGGKLGMLDVVTTTLLFSPLFALIVGYFVLWEPFVEHAASAWAAANAGAVAAATAAGGAAPEFSALSAIGPYLLHYWWLPLGMFVAIALGFALFGMRQKMQADRTSFLPVLLWSLRNRSARKSGEGFFDPARREFGDEAGDGPPAVLKIMVVFSMVSVFWALFDQHASTWIDQARQMNLGLFVPAWIAYWVAFPLTIGLSLYAGIWLFFWIGNRPLPKASTKVVVGAVLALGVLAGALDLVGPPAGNRVVNLVLKTVDNEELKAVTRALKTGVNEAVPVGVEVVAASNGAVTDADLRRAEASRALLATVRLVPAPATVALAAEKHVEVKNYASGAELMADLEARRARIAAEPRPRMRSIQMDAAQLSALNPLMVMLIIPGLGLLFFGPLRKRWGIEVKPLQKMTAGMFLSALAFTAAALLQILVERLGDGVVHGLWQAVPYFIMTTAEVLVSITGLEFAYTQAPRAMKSTIMSFWLLCVTFGNLIVAFLAPLQKTFSLSSFFWVFTVLMAGAAAVFAFLAARYKGKTYLQGDAAKSPKGDDAAKSPTGEA